MSETTTEWHNPTEVAQDHRFKEVNGGTCNPFYNLSAIKENNVSKYARQSYYINGEWSKGTHKNRPSPVVYAYNFGFQVPSDAEVTSVTFQYVVLQGTFPSRQNLKTNLLKMKTTASVTDTGGNSKDYKASSSEFWNTEDADWSYFTRKITSSESHVKLTPSLVNSSNFGFIIQAIGTMDSNISNSELGGWDDPWIAKMQVRVTYTVPVKSVSNAGIPIFKMNAYIKDTDLQTLSLDYPSKCTYLTIYLEHQIWSENTYCGGTTPQITITGSNDQYLISEKKQTQYLVQPQNVASGSKPDNKTFSIEIYPWLVCEKGKIIVEVASSDRAEVYTGVDKGAVTNPKIEVSLPVNAWKGYTNLQTSIESKTLEDTSYQGCIIMDNTFDECSAMYGGSYYASEEQDFITRTYEGSRVDSEGYAIYTDVGNQGSVQFTIGEYDISGTWNTWLAHPYSAESFVVTDFEGHVATEYITLRKYWFSPKEMSKRRVKDESTWNVYKFSLDYNFKDEDTRVKFVSPFTVTFNWMVRYERTIAFTSNNHHINMTRSSKKYQKGCFGNYDYWNELYTYKENDN